jgi:cyclopropane fatty-acyl-phospholipid synthase-like methyltransferase
MSEYTEDYFLKGEEKKLSNFTNYRWMPDLTLPFAERLIRFLDYRPHESILDFGCARGYLVKALRLCNVRAYGYDISSWAIKNCDPEVKDFISMEKFEHHYDHIIAKDVLEHIGERELATIIRNMDKRSRKSIFIIVPLAKKKNGLYYRQEDEQDTTHKLRWTFDDWFEFLKSKTSGTLLGSTHVEDVKPASEMVPGSTGFFWIRK